MPADTCRARSAQCWHRRPLFRARDRKSADVASYQDVERAIERAFRPHAVFVPSARLGLILAFKHFLSPGDGVLMTSVCCESVVLALYAAGVHPIFVDMDLRSGNIDCAALAQRDIPGARAVLTTNLYGVPDDLPTLVDICRTRGWLLIEDCAQVIDSIAGSCEAGSIGVAAVYSFRKFLDERGGAVMCQRAADAAAIRQRAADLSSAARPMTEWCRHLQGALGLSSRSLGGLCGRMRHLVERARRTIGRKVGVHAQRRRLLSQGLGESLRTSNGHPERVYQLLSEDLADFRRYPARLFVRRLSEKLQDLPKVIAQIREANDRLLDTCPLSRPQRSAGAAPCYLAIPFWTAQRDLLRMEIERLTRTSVYYIYDPPLADCLPAGSYADYRSSPSRDAEWCRSVLPIRGAQGAECVNCVRQVLAGEKGIVRSRSVVA